jgi:protein-S-isoprenylcysteine O-methyltransferase Ste14
MASIATTACWTLVVATWIAAARYWRRDSRRTRQRSARALWGAGLVVGSILVVRLTWGHIGQLTDHAAWIELPGLVLLVVSTVFTIWARLRLGRMWSSSPNVLQSDHELQTDGPYAITRHPIYTGLLGMVVGTVLVNGLGSSLAFLVIAAVFLANRIPMEEHLMSKTFPEAYSRYRARVPLLVPGLHLHRRAQRT